MRRFEIAALGLVLAFGQSAYGQTSPQAPAKPAGEQKDDLTNLDVMDLAKMTVTSASKKAESIFGVAAAMSVVTAEDIKRSGATNIPEALRMVPGVQVQQVNATQYAVSIRGFNSPYADKLLVLIDGRSIYNNFFGGVYWEDQAISMDEIDRIEVIRGPGGTLWGANAVNGVINIITKQAKDTKGVYLSGEGATKGTTADGTLRYGGSFAHGDFRITALGLRDVQSESLTNTDNGDQRNGEKVSFRYDGGTEETGKVLLEGDLHRFDYGMMWNAAASSFPYAATTTGTYSSLGGSILAKIEKSYKDGSSNSFQASYDHMYKPVFPDLIDRDGTIDIQLQHSFQPLGNNSVIAGAGYRTTADDYTSSVQSVSPLSETMRVYSFFAQDQIQLNPTTRFTAGTKVEHNDFTAWEVEPSARLSVQPDDKQTWWCSLSRAVQTPNRAYDNLNWPFRFTPVPFGGNYYPGTVNLIGNPNLKSTDMVAAETGYRTTLGSRASLDISVYQNSYTHLTRFIEGSPIIGSPIVVPYNNTDIGSATVRGFEISSKFQASDKLRFDFGYSYAVSDADGGDFSAPKHEIKELGTYTFNDKLSFDQAIYFDGASSDGTPSYHRMDVQLRYKASKNCDLSVGGRNLGMGSFNEFGSSSLIYGQMIQPAAYAQFTVKY